MGKNTFSQRRSGRPSKECGVWSVECRLSLCLHNELSHPFESSVSHSGTKKWEPQATVFHSSRHLFQIWILSTQNQLISQQEWNYLNGWLDIYTVSRYKVRASQTENVEMMSMVGHTRTRQSPVFYFSFSIRKSVQIQRNPGHIRTFHRKLYREKDGETSGSMKLRSCLILVKF